MRTSTALVQQHLKLFGTAMDVPKNQEAAIADFPGLQGGMSNRREGQPCNDNACSVLIYQKRAKPLHAQVEA